MAKFIDKEKKTGCSCYNFHDRMKQKYGSFDNIVQQLKHLYDVKEEDICAEREKRRKEENEVFQWLI